METYDENLLRLETDDKNLILKRMQQRINYLQDVCDVTLMRVSLAFPTSLVKKQHENLQ